MLIAGFSSLNHLYPLSELCYKPNIEQITPLSEGSSSLNTAAKTSAHFPPPAYEQQDVVFLPAFELLRQAIAQHVFPAASVAVTHQGKLVALKAIGRFTYDLKSPEVTTASIFDLASVSKVVATTSLAMILYQRGLLDLEMPVVGVLPEFRGEDSRRGEITFRQLLAHSSGIPAYEKLFLHARSSAEFLREAFA